MACVRIQLILAKYFYAAYVGVSFQRGFEAVDILNYMDSWIAVFVVIGVVNVLLRVAISKGYFVKVEYSHSKRLFWALLNSAIISSMYFISGSIYFLVLAVVCGLYVYSRTHHHAFRPNKN
ncbi:hypothetical protein [Thalassotalea fusca]